MISLIFSLVLTTSNYFQIQEVGNEIIVECINGHHCNANYPWMLIENAKEIKPKYIDTYQAAFQKPKSKKYKIKLGTCNETMCQSVTVEMNKQ